MNISEFIEALLKEVDASYYTYDKKNNRIEKKTIFVNSSVEQSEMLRIIEVLDELGIKYTVEINGDIKIKI